MERKAHKRIASGGWIVVACCALLALIFLKGRPVEEQTPKNSSLLLIYSPYCPHCHALMDYLEKKGISVEKTTDGRKATEILKKYNMSWDYGVPLLLAEVNGSVIAIEGFPTPEQNKNGYFNGREYEEKMCKAINGEKVVINGTYAFCKLPNGFILGNVHAVDYLIEKTVK